MRQAVCFLQPAFYGAPTLYLAVTRPGRPNDWGLPGGKVEDGETLEEAIIREVKEETGLTICDPVPVYHRISQTEQFEVTVFTGTVIAEDKPKEDLRVGYISKKKLIDGPFGDFNREMFEKLDPDIEERPLLQRYNVVGDHLNPDPHGRFVFANPALIMIEGLEKSIQHLMDELSKQPITDVTGHTSQDFEIMRLLEVITKLEDLLFEALPWIDDRHEDRLYQRIKAAIPPWAGSRAG